MWILTGASLIRSCWMSVLTATNSTWASPASIIRSSAFRPAPPTPTTLITARYAAVSPRGTRWSLGACSGSVCSIGGGSGTGSSRTGSGSGSGSGSASGSGTAATAGSSAACANSGTCSTVSSCGSRAAGRISGSGSPFSACFCAASVARKSSASGPSRMLARRRAIENLLRELAVGLRGTTCGVVLEHRAALHRRLGIADRLANLRPEDETAEVLFQNLDRLARVQRALVVHGRQDSLNPDLGIEVLADHRECVLELDESAQREVLALDRHDHAVRGDQVVDRQQAERCRRVDQDLVVVGLHGRERLLERPLAADHARERQLGAGEIDLGNSEIDLQLVYHL